MRKILLCLIYGSVAAAAVALITETLHTRAALGWTLAYLAAINLVAFAFYVFDKVFVGLLQALHVRVPETLLIWGLAFLGGWAGAALAMFMAHHKTGPDSTAFRMELLAAYAVSVTLALAVLVIAQQPSLSFERADPVIAQFVAVMMNVVRAVLVAVIPRT